MPSSHVPLSEHERSTLESWTRASTISAGHAERARIVLAIADGVGTSATASLVGVSRPTVIKWRDRCAVRGLAGLDDEPPQNAIVLCVDEKSQIQALNRTQPILPVRPGLPAKATHDYKRNGTTTLFAALEVATGSVLDRCDDPTARPSSWTSSNRSRAPTRVASCTSCSTTTTPTSTTTSTSGWPSTPGSPCTSRPRPGLG